MNKSSLKQSVEFLDHNFLGSISGGDLIKTSLQNKDGTWSPVKYTLLLNNIPNKKFFIKFNAKFKTQNEADQYILEYYRKPYMY